MFIRTFSIVRNTHTDKEIKLRDLPITFFKRKKIPENKRGSFRNNMLLWCCVFVIRKRSEDYSRQTYVKPLSETCTT